MNVAPVNSVPGAQTMAEDATLVFSTAHLNAIAIDDVDAGGGSLTVTLAVTGGALTLASKTGLAFTGGDGLADPSMTFSGTLADINAALNGLLFAPAANDHSDVTLTITTNDNGHSDGDPLEDSDTVAITVTPVNDPPTVANPIADQTLAEDAAWTFQVPAGTFADIDGDSLSFSATLADGGALPVWIAFDKNSRTFSGQPPANFSGAIDIKVTTSDGTLSADDTFTLTIPPTNDGPVVASPIADQTIAEDSSWAFHVPVGTFTDVDNPSLNYNARLAGGSALPAWLLFNRNTATFNSASTQNFNGVVDIEVIVSDGMLSATDTFRLTVTSVNDAPVLVHQTVNQNLAEDTSWTFQVPDDAFGDVEGDTLIYSATLGNGSPLPAWLAFTPATRTFNGTPPLNFNGAITLKVTASDGALSDSESFVLTITAVNDAPAVIQPIPAQNAVEDTAWTFQVPPGTFADAEGDPLTYSASLADGGTLPASLAFDPLTRTFSGKAPADFNGALALKVIASDGALSNGAVFDLIVAPVNDAPVVKNPLPDLASPEDTAWTFKIAANTFADIDGDSLLLSATAFGGGALPEWMAFDAQTGTFSGLPPANVNGAVGITVTASDGTLAVEDSFTLVITPVNDAPTLANPIADQVSGEDLPWSFQVPPGTFTDVDNGVLTYTAALATGGPLLAWLSFDGATQTFSGTPPADATGFVDLKVTASDGVESASDVFRFSIVAADDPPRVVHPIPDQTSPEDKAWGYPIPAGTFIDVEGSTLSYSATLANGDPLPDWLTLNPATRIFVGTPPANFNGHIDIKVIASDGALSGEDVFGLTITPVNDGPTLANAIADQVSDEDAVWAFTLPADAFVDIDGDTLAFSATLESGSPLPGWLSFHGPSRTFSGIPPSNFSGSLDLKVTAGDGAVTVSDSFRLTILPVNDPPSVAATGSVTTNEDTVSASIAVGASDPEGNSLTYSIQPGSGPALGNVALTGGKFTYTPNANVNGADSFTIVVTDSLGASATQLVNVTINPVNDAPVVVGSGIANQSLAEDAAWSFAVPGAAFNDIDSPSLTYSASLASGAALPGWLAFIAATGTFSGTPPADFNGVLDLKVTASDGALSASDTFRLTVTPVNDTPVGRDDTVSALLDAATTYTAAVLLKNDTDADGDPLTVTTVANASHGSVSLAGGKITFVAEAGFVGSAGFDYTISDMKGGIDTAHVTVMVAMTGIVADGYLAGATVFADADGRLDPGDPFTISDAHGDYVLPGVPVGSLHAQGGFNVDTGLANLLPLSAPAGSTVINPLTTLIQALAQRGSSTAESQVELAFGLDPTLALTSLDLSAAIADPDAFAAKKAAVTIAEVLGDVVRAEGDVEAALDKLAMLVGAGGAVDLAAPAVLAQIFAAGLPGASQERLDVLVADARQAAFAIQAAQDLQAIAEIQSANTPPGEWRLFANSGFAGEIGGTGTVFGTSGFEDIRVLDRPGTVAFDPTFNRGGDVVRLHGEAADWFIVQSGSNATFTDGDTIARIPIGTVGLAISFDDGVRILRYDAAGGRLMIGEQSFAGDLAAVASPAGGALPGGAIVGATARLFMATGGEVEAGGRLSIFGTNSDEDVTLTRGTIGLDPSFNRGGDRITLQDNASDFDALRLGSSIALIGSGYDVSIPLGSVGTMLVFDDDERVLRHDLQQNAVFIGTQAIGQTITPLAEIA